MAEFEQVVDLSNLYIDNLQISYATTTTLSVAAGRCRDDSNQFDIVLDEAVTLNAAVLGENGIDVGAIAASKMYNVFILADVTEHNDPVVMMSLSSSPVMPEGYNIKRQIGYWPTNASAQFHQGAICGNGKERVFHYDSPPIVLENGAASGWTNISLANVVPAIDNTAVYFSGSVITAAGGIGIGLKPPGGPSEVITWSNQVGGGTIAAYHTFKMLSRLASDVPAISYQVGAATTADIYVESFDFYV